MTAATFRRLLKWSGQSAAEAARDLGVERSTVSRWLSGEREIRPSAARLINLVIRDKRK